MSGQGLGHAVVCAVDLGPSSRRAAAAGCVFAGTLGAPLVLVHVLPEVPPALHDARKLEAAQALAELADQLERPRTPVVTRVLAPGDPVEAVSASLAELRARLLVLGAPLEGRLGRVARALVSRAFVPTLVVRDERPIERWRAGEALAVLFAGDFSLSAKHAAHWLESLAETAPLEVTALHVYWPPEQHARLGLAGVRPLETPDPVVAQTLARELRETLFPRASVHTRADPHLGRVGERVVATAQELGAALVVVGAHARTLPQRLWEGSVSNLVARDAKASVLVVPLPREARPEAPRPVRRVVVGCDFSAASDAAVALAPALVPAGGTVHLVHVVRTVVMSELTPRDLVAEAVVEHPDVLAQLKRRALEAGAVRVELHVLEARDVAMALCAAAERFDADLLVVGARGRSALADALLGSVAKGVVERARVPVVLAKAAQR